MEKFKSIVSQLETLTTKVQSGGGGKKTRRAIAEAIGGAKSAAQMLVLGAASPSELHRACVELKTGMDQISVLARCFSREVKIDVSQLSALCAQMRGAQLARLEKLERPDPTQAFFDEVVTAPGHNCRMPVQAVMTMRA